jgi:adenylate kinase family enzyme
MSARRIHIIGGPGSGKSYIAHLISDKYSIPALDLDTISGISVHRRDFTRKRVGGVWAYRLKRREVKNARY